jgi:ubiquitin-activating enzyme E1 C
MDEFSTVSLWQLMRSIIDRLIINFSNLLNRFISMIPPGVDVLLASKGPFCQDVFASGQEGRDYFLNSKVLVIGAGGLGCELLKSLALTGFRNIDVIDMDTIDISNLNRQFLFRRQDVGKPKCVVAAEFIRKRCPGINITPYFGKIQDKDEDYYKSFHVIIGGLDSIDARNWISSQLCKIARETHDEYVIPYIDGGTEAWKGHVKVIHPNQTACMICQAPLFPPPVVFQECTVVSFPRQPSHCVIWAKEVKWQEDRKSETIDGDNEEHIDWIFARAQERAIQFKIEGLTRPMTKGVVKNIIAAIASLQAVIAAMCATEALKIVTGVGPYAQNNLLYSAEEGTNMTHFFFERNPKCPECSRRLLAIPAVKGETVSQLMKRLTTEFNFPATALRANEVIYLAIQAHTAANLEKPITDFVAAGDAIIATSRERDQPFEFLIDGI